MQLQMTLPTVAQRVPKLDEGCRFLPVIRSYPILHRVDEATLDLQPRFEVATSRRNCGEHALSIHASHIAPHLTEGAPQRLRIFNASEASLPGRCDGRADRSSLDLSAKNGFCRSLGIFDVDLQHARVEIDGLRRRLQDNGSVIGFLLSQEVETDRAHRGGNAVERHVRLVEGKPT